MTTRHCRICNDWHDLDEPWPEECIAHYRHGRSSDAPNIIRDGIEMKSMVDGKVYTSKNAYYKSLGKNGLYIDDRRTSDMMPEGPNRPKDGPSDVGRDVKRAWDSLN